MGVFVFILVIAVLIAMTVLNHATAEKAMQGVEFTIAAPPSAVSSAISAVYCSTGVRASLSQTLRRIQVSPSAGGFSYRTKRYGDSGQLSISGNGSTTTVRASTTNLYVGSGSKLQPRSGIWALGVAIGDSIARILGITPGAAMMKTFQNKLERAVSKNLSKVH